MSSIILHLASALFDPSYIDEDQINTPTVVIIAMVGANPKCNFIQSTFCYAGRRAWMASLQTMCYICT